MLKTYYYWNNKVFTNAEELKDAIIDFISEICHTYAVDEMVLDIMQYEVQIKNELFTTSGEQIQNLPRIYNDIARRKLCSTVYS